MTGSAGIIAWFPLATPPSNWLECNGQAVSRTTYATLFEAIGTFWGSGDGSSTFNVPDLRGVFVRGWDDNKGVDIGRVFGTTQTAANAPHYHSNGTLRIVVSNASTTFQGKYPALGGETSEAHSGGGAIQEVEVSSFTYYDIVYAGGTSAVLTGHVANQGTEARPLNIALLPCIDTGNENTAVPSLSPPANLLPNARQQFFNADGLPLAGGSVYTYVPSTTTPKTTWEDETMLIPNSNPIILDSGGYATIWGTGLYRQIVEDSLGNLIWDSETGVDLESVPYSLIVKDNTNTVDGVDEIYFTNGATVSVLGTGKAGVSINALATGRFRIACGWSDPANGPVPNNTVLYRNKFDKTVEFLTSENLSSGVCGTAFATGKNFLVQKNGAGAFMKIRVSGSQVVPTMISNATFAKFSDIITITAPATQAQTGSNVGFLIVGIVVS